ncbi:MAG: DNA gyrase inhibitor YacG [Alphaproteobacteria bacterium]
MTGKEITRRGCPICGKPTVSRFRPFCSDRCRDVDLSRWLGGHYRIPTQDTPERGRPEKSEEPE